MIRVVRLQMNLSVVLLGACLLFGSTAFGHGGGLNKDGFHNDRKNGGYHCHRKSVANSAPKPQRTTVPLPVRHNLADDGEAAYYANCSEARDAGADPLHRGEPGYREKMDGDGDGVACE